jgi:hypothetical protein
MTTTNLVSPRFARMYIKAAGRAERRGADQHRQRLLAELAGTVLALVADRSGVWPRIAGGCHPARDTTAAITEAGFRITGIERFMFAPSTMEPSMPHILGRASRS